MNVAEKVFRKVKTENNMPEEDLELSLDNVDKGELFAEAQSMSRTQLKQMVSHLLLNITDVPSTSGIVTMWLSKIKLASKEVAKTDGQPRALHEEEEENQYWAD